MSAANASVAGEKTPPEATPSAATPAEAPTAEPTAAEPTTTAATATENTDAAPEVDGSGLPGNGSSLQEPEFNVEVKLADLQADPNNPLFSAQSFEQLNL